MHENELIALDRRHVWHPFTQEQTAPAPIPVVSAQGSVLHGADGREYIDLIASWWVTTHGHAHPHVARAIGAQAARMEQVLFAGMTHPPAIELSTRLAQLLPGELSRVFFSDNGSTAVEVALKVAVQYWYNQGQKRTRLLAFHGGYHGDTVGAMSMGRTSGFFDPFLDMLFAVEILPFPETWIDDTEVEQREALALAALEEQLTRHPGEIAGVLIEPLVQGAAGMRMCRPAFLQKLAQRLQEADVLLIFDEVMTGFGRTGSLFACQKAAVAPDIIALSKGLTAGFLPMSVTVTTPRVYQAFLGDTFDRAFAHGHSFTANPLGCAAALASLEVFEQEHTLARIAAIETQHRAWLDALTHHPRIRRARVTGSIAALEVVVEDSGYTSQVGPYLRAYFLERGLLIRPLGNIIYLMPPYCTTREQLARGHQAIEDAIASLP